MKATIIVTSVLLVIIAACFFQFNDVETSIHGSQKSDEVLVNSANQPQKPIADGADAENSRVSEDINQEERFSFLVDNYRGIHDDSALAECISSIARKGDILRALELVVTMIGPGQRRSSLLLQITSSLHDRANAGVGTSKAFLEKVLQLELPEDVKILTLNLDGLFTPLGIEDTKSLLQIFAQQEDIRGSILSRMATEIGSSRVGIDGIFKGVRSLNIDDSLNKQLMERSLAIHALWYPGATAQELNSYPELFKQATILESIALGLSKENPQNAAKWLETLPSAATSDSAVGLVFGRWIESDSIACSNYVQNMKPSTHRDMAISNIVNHLVALQDLSSARQWIQEISNTEIRETIETIINQPE